MALTPSTMLPLGTALPRELMLQRLTPVSGPPLAAVLEPARPLLVLFLCPHCPYVKHIEPTLSRLQADWGERAAIVGICSNSSLTHPQDGPEGMAEQARRNGWTFAYLQDPEQVVARAFHAACTPDPFLFDADGQLAYRGQLDASRPGSAAGDAGDLRAALDALLAGGRPDPEQTPAIGCNIKWHPGTEAEQFGSGA